MFRKTISATLLVLMTALYSVSANATLITTTKLTGLTGGSPAETAVYRANLNDVGLSQLLSISILDNSGLLGGSPGQFSGFDLDAIILSNTLCATAACVAALPGINLFDYTPTGTFFAPGTQRVPVDPKLFGTDVSGLNVDNAVATLGAFDGDSSTLLPDGFISMGDNGKLGFNLTSAISTAGLYLYFGEVGDNGEVAASDIRVSSTTVPEPTSLMILAIAIALLAMSRTRINNV